MAKRPTSFGIAWVDSLLSSPAPRAAPEDAKRPTAPQKRTSSFGSSWFPSLELFSPRREPGDLRARLDALERENGELRAQVLAHEALLDGWSRFVRDSIHAAVFLGREAHFAALLTDALRRAVAESDGVTAVEVVALRLPRSARWSPVLSLAHQRDEHVTRWAVEWQPPSEQCSMRIRLRGATFGRKFTVEADVRDLRVSGTLRVAVVPARGGSGEVEVSFEKAPALDMKVQVLGSWVGSPLKPLIVHILGKFLANNCVEPNRVVRPLPGLPMPTRALPGAEDAEGLKPAPPAPPGPAPKPEPAREPEASPLAQALLALQRRDGLWALDSRLAAALGTALPTLLDRMPEDLRDRQLYEGADADGPPAMAWASAVVVAVLRLRLHDEAGAWEARVDALRFEAAVQSAAMEAVLDLGLPRERTTPGDAVASRVAGNGASPAAQPAPRAGAGDGTESARRSGSGRGSARLESADVRPPAAAVVKAQARTVAVARSTAAR